MVAAAPMPLSGRQGQHRRRKQADSIKAGTLAALTPGIYVAGRPGPRAPQHHRQRAALPPAAGRQDAAAGHGSPQTMHHRHQGQQHHRHRKPGWPGRRPGPSTKAQAKAFTRFRITPRLVHQDRRRQRVGTTGPIGSPCTDPALAGTAWGGPPHGHPRTGLCGVVDRRPLHG